MSPLDRCNLFRDAHPALKLCDMHQTQLQEAVRTRGLEPLVATGKMCEDPNDPQNFDPLVHAHNAIIMNATSVIGLQAVVSGDCPVCDVASPRWVDHAADEALNVARLLGLVDDAA